jgi:caffeoyl-CoA O-methyltransferase
MDLLSDELKSYLESSCDPESDLLKQIDRETHLKVSLPRMLSGHYQGRVLSMFSKLIHPRRILEVGTFTGYASLCLAEGLSEDGILHTIDINAELEDMVRASFDKSDLGLKIKYHIGNALEIIPNLNEIFDLIFIDADKKNNESYYNLTIDKLRSGGLIIVDNVLWSGKVIAEKKTDSATTLISNFNEMVSADQRVEKLILPVRDGIFIIRKK